LCRDLRAGNSGRRRQIARAVEEGLLIRLRSRQKIRDAVTPSDRIKLFVLFADDRIQKLKYTLAHPNTFDKNRAEELNGLINAYSGCVDDAADLIELGHEKQQDIRAGIKALKAKTQEFLEYLQTLQKDGPELESYKDTLDDAIEATQDALDDATKAEKDISAPIRKKQVDLAKNSF